MKSFIAAATLVTIAAAAGNSTTGANPNQKNCKDSRAFCESGSTGNCEQAFDSCQQSCEYAYDACRDGPAAYQSSCVAEYSSCLGELPAFLDPNDQDTTVVVTKVVQSYVTYCPEATSFYNNGQLYSASGPSIITVTNCPCTVTSTVGSGSVGTTVGAYPARNTSVPVVSYKGAAASNSRFVAGGLSAVAAIAGVLAFAL